MVRFVQIRVLPRAENGHSRRRRPYWQVFAEFRPARGWDTASPKPRMGVMPGMNHILGFAQLLASRKGLTEKQEASVRQILESGRPLLTLIDHILGFSKSDPSDLSFDAAGAPRLGIS